MRESPIARQFSIRCERTGYDIQLVVLENSPHAIHSSSLAEHAIFILNISSINNSIFIYTTVGRMYMIIVTSGRAPGGDMVCDLGDNLGGDMGVTWAATWVATLAATWA